MLTSFSWVPRGAMRPTPLLSSDTEEQARAKLMAQYGGGVASAKTTARRQRQAAADGSLEDLPSDAEDVVGLEEEEEGLNTRGDREANEALRAIAGGGANNGVLEELTSEDDEDINDTTFQDTDLVFCTACADRENPRLELFVYDEPQDNLYVHHDVELSSFPLATCWLTDSTMSCVALGTMLPLIEVWPLDVMDAVSPMLVLGGCVNQADNYKLLLPRNRRGAAASVKAKYLQPDSHTEAVLCVRWNTIAQNILVSGSADNTIKIWDLHQAASGAPEGFSGCLGTYREAEKVQSLAWHPADPNLLLSGGFDGAMQLRDCRDPSRPALRFGLSDVVEHVEFSHFCPADAATGALVSGGHHQVVASASNGEVACFDTRYYDAGAGAAASGVWRIAPPHGGGEVTFSLSRHAPGLMATGGKDGRIALWDTRQLQAGANADGSAAPRQIVSRSYRTGAVLSLEFHPNSPHILGAAGAAGQPLVYTITDDLRGIYE